METDTTRVIKLKRWRELVSAAKVRPASSLTHRAFVARMENELALGRDLAPADVVQLERITHA